MPVVLPTPSLPLQPLTSKEVLQRIGEFYSVPLQETTNDQGGLDYRVGGTAGGPMAAKYLMNLKRAVTTIYPLPNSVKKDLATANDIGVWETLHLVNSSIFSTNIGARRLTVPVQDNSSGQWGNISKAYCTPYITPLSASQLANANSGIDPEKCKLLSNSQVKLVQGMTPLLLLDNGDGETFALDIGESTPESLDSMLDHLVQEGYRPVRLLFNNLPKALSLMFNVAGINDELRKLWEAQEQQYFEDLVGAGKLEKLSSKALRDRFGVNIGDAISSKTSNNSFYAIVEHDGRLRSVSAVQKKWAFFGLPGRTNGTPSFNEGAFVSQRLQSRPGVNRLTATAPDGGTYRVPFQVVSVEQMLVDNNWQNVREPMESVPEGRFNVLQYFGYKSDDAIFRPQVADLLKTTLAFTVGLGDEDIENAMKAAAETSEHFKLVRAARTNGDTKFVDDRRVVFNQHPSNDVVVEVYERGQKDPRSTASQEFPWVYLRKENLAFEREKVMTMLFMNKRIEFLRSQGHTNIKVVLERPVTKHSGENGVNFGFVDLGVFSTSPAGVRMGQMYEFKAWEVMGAIQAGKLEQQANNYNVDQWVSAEKITMSHDGGPVNRVLGLNLDLTNYEALAHAPIGEAAALAEEMPLRTTQGVLGSTRARTRVPAAV